MPSVRDRGPSIRSTPRSKRPSFRHEAWPTDRSLRPSQNRRSTDPGVEIDLWGPTAGFGPYPGPRPHNPVSPSLWLRRISSFSSGTCRTATARGPGRTKRWPGELSSQVRTACRPHSTPQRAGRATCSFVFSLALVSCGRTAPSREPVPPTSLITPLPCSSRHSPNGCVLCFCFARCTQAQWRCVHWRLPPTVTSFDSI